MDNRLTLLIILIATVLSTCKLNQEVNLDTRNDSKKIRIKGDNNNIQLYRGGDMWVNDTTYVITFNGDTLYYKVRLDSL